MDTKYLKLAIRILIASGLLIWVFSRVDHEQLWQAVRNARSEYLVLLWATSLAFFVVRSYRLRLILKQQSLEIGTFTIFKVSAATALYSLLLPGLMSTGAKWYMLKKATGKGTNIFNGMVYNQLSELIVMSACALLVLTVTNPTSFLFPNAERLWLLPTLCAIALTLLVTVTLCLLNPRTSGCIPKAVNYVMKWLPEKIQRKGSQTIREATMFQKAGWRFHSIMVLLNIITQVVGTTTVFILAAKAANLSIPLTVYIWLTSLVFILGRIPITVANLGVREVTLVGVLAAYGAEESSTLLMSMIIFSTIVLKAIIGAGFMIQWSLAKKDAA